MIFVRGSGDAIFVNESKSLRASGTSSSMGLSVALMGLSVALDKDSANPPTSVMKINSLDKSSS